MSRFSEKPNTCIKNTPPISDTGMATTGTSAERNDPRNRKITTITIRMVSPSVLATSFIASSMYDDESYATRADIPVGSSSLICIDLGVDAPDHVQRAGVGQHPDAHEHGLLAREADVLIVFVGAQHHVRHVFQPDQRAVLLADHQLLEPFDANARRSSR